MISLMSRILAIAGKYRRNIKIAFIFSFLKSMLAKSPIGLAFIAFNAFYNNKMSDRLCFLLGITLIVCVLFQAVFQNISDRLQGDSGYRIFSDMRMELGRHLRKLPMGYFTEGNIGKISSVLSTDMVFIEENCMTVIADMMSYIFAEIIMIIFMFYLNIWLGILSLLIAGAILWLGKAMEHSTIRQEQSEKLTNAVLDFIEGISIIKTYNLLGEKSAELSNNFKESCRTNLEFEETHAPWQRWLNIIYGLGIAAILALSLYLQTQNLLTVPYLIGVTLFVFDLFGPLKALYSQSTRLTVMSSCMDRVEDVLAQKELPDDGMEVIPEQSDLPEIKFKNVSFSYDKKEVLHNINFTLEKIRCLLLWVHQEAVKVRLLIY